MKRNKGQNVLAFNADIKNDGRYKYTDFDRYSVYIATKRQTEEIVKLLKTHTSLSSSILDVGCGDGTFTFEIYNKISPKKIVGFDKAQSAIKVAQKSVKVKDRDKVFFHHGDVYDAHKMFKKNSFDIVVIRGVLHHVDNPKKAIKSLSMLSNKFIVLEPNGYNPILKVIEKISPYHRAHEEKSYLPHRLNNWFGQNSFIKRNQIYFSIVPYFCPELIARTLKSIEPIIEKMHVVKLLFCGTNLVYYERVKIGTD